MFCPIGVLHCWCAVTILKLTPQSRETWFPSSWLSLWSVIYRGGSQGKQEACNEALPKSLDATPIMPALGSSYSQGELSPETQAAAACPSVPNLSEVSCTSEASWTNRDSYEFPMDLTTFGTLEEECGFLSGQEPMLPSWKNSGGIPLDSA